MNVSFQFSWGRFFILCLLIGPPFKLWAEVQFWKVFPNTLDDTHLEYVEWRNTGCDEEDISGYIFSDMNGKAYSIVMGTKIAPHESFHLSRTLSKIILNNENETLFLKKSTGELVDEFGYVHSTKGEIITDESVADHACHEDPPTETSTGTVHTGSTQTGSTEPPPTQTGTTHTGTTNTGTTGSPPGSGSTLQPPSQTGGTVSGEIPPIVDTGSTNTGVIVSPPIHTGGETPPPNTGSTLPPEEEISFPEIIPTFQNYTNTIHSGTELLCVTTPCRLNITLEPIFTGGLKMSNFTCRILFGTGIYDTCNPRQLAPFSGAILTMQIIHKTSGQGVEQSFSFRFLASSEAPPDSPIPPPIIDTNPPVVHIQFDGKIRKYHDFTGENELTCYTFTCAVNLSAENSYDPEGSKISYLWYYGWNDIKTSRDPGERKYGHGDHQIWLRVIDARGNVGEIRYMVHVVGPRTDEKITKKVQPEKKIRIHKEKSSKKTAKKKKRLKMIFFDPPRIALQSKKVISLTSTEYICTTKTRKCSLNLTLTGTQKGIFYRWVYPDGTGVTSNNPRSRSFGVGTHEILVSAFFSDATNPLWQESLIFSVTQIKKKTKKSKKYHKAKTVGKNLKKDKEQFSPAPQKEDGGMLSLVSLFFSCGLLGFLSLRKMRFLSKFRDQ